MDSDDEFELFAPAEQTSPVPERKLKRLKKAVKVCTVTPSSPSFDDAPSASEVNLSQSQSPILEESNEEPSGSGLGSEGLNGEDELSSGSGGSDAESEKSDDQLRDGSESEGFEEKNEFISVFDGLGVEEAGVRAKRVLDFEDVGEGVDGKGEKPSVGLTTEGSDKQRRRFEELDGASDESKEKKTKKRRVKSSDDDEKWEASGSIVKMMAKERREHLKQLHAESQRLLRETRDASFKPVPLVQTKSISSILDKIRQRKLELSKKSVILKNDFYAADNDSSYGEAMVDSDGEDAPICEPEVVIEETIVKHVEIKSVLDVTPVDGSGQSVNHSSHDCIPNQMDVDKEAKQAFRAPIDDTQELFSDSQDSDINKPLSNELSNSPLEEVFAPSLLAMNLKLDSALPDDVSDEEDETDKENVDPHLHRQDDLSSSPRGDPVKAFVDDEAEEEDDSDNDQLLFQENEENEENGDFEEVDDIIATGFKEKPIDTEMRNQLHQKWLEQQDENLLQRLKYGSEETKTHILEDDDEEEEEEDELDDETAEDLAPKDLIRTTLKKVKQMIPLMFTDKEDPYLSSEDEETEKRLVKQCLRMKTEEKAVFLSPAEDAGSKEVFGLIKKMNVLPDTRRKAKASTPFDMSLIGGNRNNSSKSSFIGRGTSCSMPSSYKNGSKARSFIFEQDDSNSRTAISEDSSDTVQRENLPTKAPAKYSSSQCKSSTQNTKNTAPETNSTTSLFEILRRSSLQSNKRTENTAFTQNESIFASFRLPKKPVKGRT